MDIDWREALQGKDVQAAYDTFEDTFQLQNHVYMVLKMNSFNSIWYQIVWG